MKLITVLPCQGPMESQNYIKPLEAQAKKTFECKACSWTGESLGAHLANFKTSSTCRLSYMRELEDKKQVQAYGFNISAFMEEEVSEPPAAGTSASSQSDADQLSMLVPEVKMLEPEVKIRLAKERPFRQMGIKILKVFV